MMPSILVVEDEPAIQELIAVNLQHAGHHVIRAGDAEGALGIVKNALPDLLLIDWMLPGMSGVSLARPRFNLQCSIPARTPAAAGRKETGSLKEARSRLNC